jgi:hypothetical protein
LIDVTQESLDAVQRELRNLEEYKCENTYVFRLISQRIGELLIEESSLKEMIRSRT